MDLILLAVAFVILLGFLDQLPDAFLALVDCSVR